MSWEPRAAVCLRRSREGRGDPPVGELPFAGYEQPLAALFLGGKKSPWEGKS